MCGLWAQQDCVEAAGVYWENMLNLTHSHLSVSVYQGVCEKEQKGYIASNRENKDVDFFIEKACTCQDLAIESVCHY